MPLLISPSTLKCNVQRNMGLLPEIGRQLKYCVMLVDASRTWGAMGLTHYLYTYYALRPSSRNSMSCSRREYSLSLNEVRRGLTPSDQLIPRSILQSAKPVAAIRDERPSW